MAGLSAAGAAAGTAIAPGVGTAVGGLLGALGDSFLGGGGGATSGGPISQNAQSAIYGDLGLDASGWNVNFAGVQSTGGNKATPSFLDSAGVGGASMSPVVIIGVALVVGLLIWKKSKSGK